MTVLALVSLLAFSSSRDPFSPPPPPLAPTEGGCRSALCQPLEDLKLVAIVSGSSAPLAMFEDRSGEGHLARRGDEVGVQGARLTHLEPACVVLTRFVGDGARGPVTERLCLAAP
jgi:Tfp pilus assembly protein PilP